MVAFDHQSLNFSVTLPLALTVESLITSLVLYIVYSESPAPADSRRSHADVSVYGRKIPCVLSAGVVQPGVSKVLSQRGQLNSVTA